MNLNVGNNSFTVTLRISVSVCEVKSVGDVRVPLNTWELCYLRSDLEYLEIKSRNDLLYFIYIRCTKTSTFFAGGH